MNISRLLRIVCAAGVLSLGLQTSGFAQNSGCVAPPAGLVSWWRAEGNANDSIRTNNGILVNGVTFANGVVGQGFHLDGTNQYVQIADSADLKPANVSVEAWVRLDTEVTPGANSPGQEIIVFKKNTRDGNFEGYVLLKNRVNGVDFFRFAIASADGLQVSADSTTGAQVGIWYHLVGTYDSGTGYLKIYVNGVQEANTYAGFPLDYGTRPIFIGTTGEWWDGKLGGTVDEVSIYNRALSTNEIAALYDAASAGKCAPPQTNCAPAPSGLVGWWPGEGNANDVVGGNNGTLEGGVIFAPGKVGQGFRLDGTNSFVQIPDSDALKPTNVTVEAWVWLDPNVTTPRLDYIIFKKNSWDYLFEGYSLLKQSLPNGDGTYTDRFSFVVSSGGNQVITYSTTAVQRGIWYHVAGTYDGNRLTLWVNGVAEASAIAGFPLDYGTRPVFIGTSGQPEPYNGKLAGIIDEASIYNRALSTNEIQAIYNAASAGKCAPPQTNCAPAPSGLVSWWKAENNALDGVAGNNGTVQGEVNYVAGEAGQAFDFNGLYSGVQLGSPANLQLQTFTIEAWVKRHSATQATLDGAHPDNGAFLHYDVGGYAFAPANDGRLLLGKVGISAVYSSALKLTDTNNFHHVAVTTTGSNVVFYLDGVAEAVGPYAPGYTFAGPVAIGGRGGDLAASFYGTIDELSVYSRALTPNEIQAIYNAGSAGKCPPPQSNCAPSPAGLISWWPAEGNATDSVGGNNGLLLNGAGFASGEVGQAFNLNGNSQCVQIPWSPALVSSNYSVEAWIDPATQVDDPIGQDLIFGQGYGHCQLVARTGTTGVIVAFQFGINPYVFPQVVSTNELPIGQFSHVVGTWDGTTLSLYINGALNAQSVPGLTPADSGCPFFIGGFYAPGSDTCSYLGQFFNGLIDEVSYFNRALSGSEVMSLYNAGSAGKCPPMPTPIIFAQPLDQTVTAGGTATFSVSAQGTPPLSYQWFLGTNLLPGQTGASLVLNNVQPAQAGYYSVVVSNSFGSLTSSNALLTVLTFPPTITIQPRDVTLFPGSNAVFSVTASGTAPLSYQWFFNNAPLAGQTSFSLLLLHVQPSQTGNYRVTVSNAYGFTVSSNALLTVLPPPVCVPPPDGIVAWWRCESNLVDSIGINDLFQSTLQPLPAFLLFTPGKVGTALQFPNAGPLQTLASDDLDLGSGVGLTIEAWIRPFSITTVQPLVEWNDSRGTVGAGLFLNPSAGPGVIGAYFTETNPAIATAVSRVVLFRSPALVITNLIWQHVALTFDRATGLAAIYVNGVSVAQTNLGTFTPMTKAPVYLGSAPGNPYPGARFNGFMDEVSLYKRALTQAEIQSIYLADYAGKCPPPPPPCVPAPSGIVAWWRGQSNILDSVNGNTGFASNSFSFASAMSYAAGKVGSAFRFDSSFIRVPASSNLNVGSGGGLTIELWVNPGAVRPMPFVEWNSGTGTQGVYFAISTSRPVFEANLWDTQGHPHVVQSPLNLISSGNWQHLAVTYDQSAGITSLYVNGVLVTRTNSGSFTPRTGTDLYLGDRPPGNYPGSGLRYTGLMDEVSIYNRALTAAEIKSIMIARGAGKCTEPPVIITPPQNQTVNPGDTAVFGVSAGGTPTLHYQWYYGSNTVVGATDSMLILTNVQTGQAGTYFVVVTNMFGSATSSNAVLRVNLPPVADASATVSPVISCNNSNATVVLNGSRSSDPDGDSLQYLWYANGGTNVIGTGVVAVAVLPVGTNSITLLVSDGWASNQQTIAIQVITIPQAIERLIEEVGATVPRSRPLVATLWAAFDSAGRGDCVPAINQLQAFQNKVKAQVAPVDAVLAQSLINTAQGIIDAILNCGCDCDDGHGHGPGHGHITPRFHGGDGKIHLDFPAPRGPVYMIEASSDFIHWEKIGVATDQNDGTFGFDDSAAARAPQRFYRVVVP